MLWLKHNHAEALGTGPQPNYVAAGAASGAHMALSLAMMPETEPANDGYSRPPTQPSSP